MKKMPIVQQDAAARRMMDALQLRVGRGRRHTFAGLEEATGIPERTLRSYVDGTAPPLHAFLSLCSVLGPAFTSDVLAECGQSAKVAGSEEPEHMRILAMLGGMVSLVSEALEDGHVDHREAAMLRPVAAQLLEMLEPLARDPKDIPMVLRRQT
ncbi:hypothetical protein ACRARG_12665 [Pseudooceanicola sp. C21-150M6]|uniref:hypothetical protein n=1 Tax=Pseudooceanicola sp. C21-150M6 TaxID=3434355 RepID=UPI003D7F4FA5